MTARRPDGRRAAVREPTTVSRPPACGRAWEVDHEDLVDGRGSLAVFRNQESVRWGAARWRLHDTEKRTATDRPPARVRQWLLNTLQSPSTSRHWLKIPRGWRRYHLAGFQPCCRS